MKFNEYWEIQNVYLSHFVWVILLIVWFFALLSSYFTVQPGQMVLVKTLGELNPTVYAEWIHWKTPFVGRVINISLRSKKIEDSATASTNDLQSIGISVAITYQITKDGAMEVYRRFGDDDAIATNVVIPNIKEAIRSVTAKYKADELITKRAEVSSLIHEKLQAKLNEFGVLVSDTNIQDISFSEKFNESIENKVKAEQDALAKKNELEKTKYEADQQVVRAKAEAETIRIQAEAVKSQGWAEYVQLKWIEKWDGKLPQTQLGSNTTMMVSPAAVK